MNLDLIIEELKSHGMVGIKSSFEDEGLTDDEIQYLRRLTLKHKIKLITKIGGCEAKRDIMFCIDNEIDGVVAPMIESKFALKKYILAINGYVFESISFNLETISAYNNFNDISSSEEFDSLTGITVGRVDLCSSMNKDRSYVDSDEIFNLIHHVFSKAKESGKATFLGGAISINSKDFIKKLVDENILDYIETRSVLFDAKKVIKEFEIALYHANYYEVRFMETVKYRKMGYALRNDSRISMINERLQKNQKGIGKV